ncbi:hypothetical protein [Winogradskyella algicola]|uniref:hypothetical protein n=1 Tax=Winogradskyella algicola TaxID=2575815 RepID=UPI00110961F7|nr:hypothetical protein [Winogradskyella algicola]
MKLFPISKNSLALLFVAVITFGFFTAGMFEVLDYFIIKALLFTLFAGLLVLAFVQALKNDTKKNRPEDELQDDSN